MDPEKSKIEKLRSSENWSVWQFTVKTLLRCDGLLEIVKEDSVKPEDVPGNASALTKWQKQDNAATKLIMLSVEQGPLQLLMNCNSAKEMWQKLHSVYDLKSSESLSLVQKQFFEHNWNSDSNMAMHISKLESLTTKIRNLGGQIDDTLLMTRILQSLPPEFDHFHCSWESTDPNTRTIASLTTRLISEEARLANRKLMQSRSDEASALSAKTTDSFIKEKGKSNVKCFNCKKIGHISRHCKFPKKCKKCGKKGHVAEFCKTSINERESKHDAKTATTETPLAFSVSDNELSKDDWIIDSGASEHITNNCSWFTSFKRYTVPQLVFIGDGKGLKVIGVGTINIQMYANSKWYKSELQGVLYVPEIDRNLFSVKTAAKKGIDFSLSNYGNNCVFKYRGKICATGINAGNLYRLQMKVMPPVQACLATTEDTLQVWHERLVHQNKKHVNKILQKLGVQSEQGNSEFCEGCVLGKQHRDSYRERRDHACKPGELVFSDVCGPVSVESIGKRRYYIVFKDDYSGYRRVYFMHNKNEVQDKLKIYLAEAKTNNVTIKELRTDGGLEYVNKDVKGILEEAGIRHTYTVPYAPEQNGVAERENRILQEAAQAMLHSGKFPTFLWAEAVSTAAYVLNLTGPTRCENKTPVELWCDKKTNIGHLKIFGTECYVHIPKQKRKKDFGQKSMKGHLVGYNEGVSGYRVWIPNRNEIVRAHDVIFRDEVPQTTHLEIGKDPFGKDTVEQDSHPLIKETEKLNELADNTENKDMQMKLRDRTKIRKPQYYGQYAGLCTTTEPANYKEALISKESHKWIEAMNEEMESLLENKTWELVNKPSDREIIDNRWVYRIKQHPDGTIDRFKARLVVKGFKQKEGVDYLETFSPVVRYDTIRTVLSVAAQENLILKQFDVKTAFLNGNLEEELYMEQPEGYEDGTDRVCRLLKGLYGLKQAPRCWKTKITDFLKSCGLRESTADPCLYYRINEGEKLIVLLYVDDGLIVSSSDEIARELLKKLETFFKITVREDVTSFLGFEIKQDERGIFILQSGYAQRVLDRYGMEESRGVGTPIEVGWSAALSVQVVDIPYREAVGNLMHLQVITRPDLAFALNVASRALENPTSAHWQLIKRILRYLGTTKNLGIRYERKGELEAYSDADYAGCEETRKSTTGILCKLSNGAITWKSKKQQCVAQSTTEAEYVSANSASREIVWLTRLLKELGINVNIPTLRVDNKSAIKLCKNPAFHPRTKHIAVKYHFVREMCESGAIEIKFIESEEQLADIFTKALAKPRFQKLCGLLNMTKCG